MKHNRVGAAPCDIGLSFDLAAPLGRPAEPPCAYQMRSLVPRVARDTMAASRIWRAAQSKLNPEFGVVLNVYS